MAGLVSVSGLVSGIQSDDIINKILEFERKPGVAIPISRRNGLKLAEERVHVRVLRIAPAEVFVHRPRPGDGVERGVRDEPVDLAADQQPLLAFEFGPLDGPLAVLGLDVAGEGVERLVVVVVAVEELEVESGHSM